MTETTFIVPGGQVHVNPGYVILDELREEARGEYVITRAFDRALHEIRGVALEVIQELFADWEWPDALPTVATDALENRVQVASVGKDT